MQITKVNCPTNKYAYKCPYYMTPKYITIHNTANDASAMSEISYMLNNWNYTSYHFAVDDYRAVQGLPLNRNGWHAGDGGNGTGNRYSIGIEICYSKSGGTRFDKAERNAAKLTAMLLKEYGWGIDRVKKHQDWSGKYCPHRTLDRGWQRFLNMIKDEMNGNTGKTGWIKDNNGWWFRNPNGTFPKNKWEKISGEWYFFNAEGYIVTGWLKRYDYWYYLQKTGEMVTGWRKINGKWYYFNRDGSLYKGWKKYKSDWFYLEGKDGEMVSDEFREINGILYRFENDGKMATKGTYKVQSDGKIIKVD